MTSFPFVLACVTLSRVNPLSVFSGPLSSPLAQSVPSSPSLALSLFLSLVRLSRFTSPFPYDWLCLASAILSPPALLAAAITPSLGPLRRYVVDGNPRCPPTDTNGYLCQRRNLLLYIPLYKQRVNRAPHPTCAAYGGPGPPVSPSSSARQVRRGYPIRARARARAMETDLSIVYSPRAFLPIVELNWNAPAQDGAHFRARIVLLKRQFF